MQYTYLSLNKDENTIAKQMPFHADKSTGAYSGVGSDEMCKQTAGCMCCGWWVEYTMPFMHNNR